MNNNDTRPLMVSIRCITYNHEPYIRQCLEGFVMQKTNFRFEAIVHDDASTDGTAAIVREYAEKYPDIIKPIFETENQYSKHDGTLDRIMDEKCTGKYIAFCEGDDYWIDPLKLQKQVDFLECHDDYSMCFHNAHLLKDVESEFKLIQVEDRDYDMDELFEKWIVPTASIMIRRNVYEKMIPDPRIINGDINTVMNACANGNVRGMNNEMSVYRVQNDGVTIKRMREDKLGWCLRYIDHFKALGELYPINRKLINRNVSNYCATVSKLYFMRNPFKAVRFLLISFITCPQVILDKVCNINH